MKKTVVNIVFATMIQLPVGKADAVEDENGDLYIKIQGSAAAAEAKTAAPAPATTASRPVADDTAKAAAPAPAPKPVAPAAAAPKAAPAPKPAAPKPATAPAPAPVAAAAEPAGEEEDFFAGEKALAHEALTTGMKVKVFLNMDPDDRKLWDATVVDAPEGEDASKLWVTYNEDGTTDFLRDTDLTFENPFNF